MGKSYYCEFCDKSFADNPSSRNKHLKGLIHRQLKKQHYESFKDPETVLRENFGKKPCRYFLNEGQCSFTNCIYSHLTPESKRRLEALVKEKLVKAAQKEAERLNYEPNLEDWLTKRAERLINDKSGDSSQMNTNGLSTETKSLSTSVNKLPDCLKNRVNLPPSLLPPDDQRPKTLDGWG